MKLNHQRIIERISELEELNVYLPLVFYRYVGVDYLDKLNDKEISKYYKHRVELMGAEDYSKYLGDEVMDWLKKYPQFKDILME